MNMNVLKIFSLLVLSISSLNSQNAIIGFAGSYSYQIPMLDLGNKYTNNSNIGLGFLFKAKSNWTAEVGGQFMFGSDYIDREQLGTMVTNGFVIGDIYQPEVPIIEGRGGHFCFEVGKIINLSKKNKNSGLHVKAGLGYLFYEALVKADPNKIPQISGNYLAGYNRLETGLSMSGYIGYTLFSDDRFVNGSIGLQSIYFNSSYLNNWDYAQNKSLEGFNFSNMLIGPKLSMVVILKKFEKSQGVKDGFFYN